MRNHVYPLLSLEDIECGDDKMTQTIDPKLLKMKKQAEQNLSRSFILDSIGAIHSIYFDLPLLQDVYLGGILLNHKTTKEYYGILQSIPYYLSRIDKAVCRYFPTSLTDEELFAYISDPANAENLAKVSPHTTLWSVLNGLIGIIINHNRVADEETGFHCDIYINLYPVKYPPIVCKVISSHLKSISSNITLKTVNMPFTELPRSVRMTPDMYFLEDNGVLFSDTSPIKDEVYVENAYDNKYIYSRKVITTHPAADIKTAFEKSKYLCNIFTHFDYVDIGIPGVEYLPPVKDEIDPATRHKLR